MQHKNGVCGHREYTSHDLKPNVCMTVTVQQGKSDKRKQSDTLQ